MPQYNTYKYGNIEKYGKYDLNTSEGGALGEHVQARLRLLKGNRPSANLINIKDASMISGDIQKIRIRTDKSNWVYLMKTQIPGNINQARIKTGDIMIHADRAHLSYSEGL